MIARIRPGRLGGSIAAIPSKSEAHRLLICAALSDQPTVVAPCGSSKDIEATARCLSALGAGIEAVEGGLRVTPIDRSRIPEKCEADCGESGSTLRFLLPVAGALGVETCFRMHGRLPERPIAPLDRELERGGCRLDRPQKDVLRIRGRLAPGAYALPGNVSSQYITGMLLALSLLEKESTLTVSGTLESAGYIDITLRAMQDFGAETEVLPGLWRVQPRPMTSPGRVSAGGDWSNAAFWLCAGAQVTGLDEASAQGDRRILEELHAMQRGGSCTVDVSGIPDLTPALAAYAAMNDVELHVIRAGRLRIKESDRIAAIVRGLNALGASVSEGEDGLIVHRGHPLKGGIVDAMGDHRIAMMAAIAATCCAGDVTIRGAECVSKSDPAFWQGFEALGGRLELLPEA